MLVKCFKAKKRWQCCGYQLSFATNELAERIRESDIFSRELHDATREFEEVARKYVLSRMPEDIKMDESKIKRREIKDIGVGGDMEIG